LAKGIVRKESDLGGDRAGQGMVLANVTARCELASVTIGL